MPLNKETKPNQTTLNNACFNLVGLIAYQLLMDNLISFLMFNYKSKVGNFSRG